MNKKLAVLALAGMTALSSCMKREYHFKVSYRYNDIYYIDSISKTNVDFNQEQVYHWPSDCIYQIENSIEIYKDSSILIKDNNNDGIIDFMGPPPSKGSEAGYRIDDHYVDALVDKYNKLPKKWYQEDLKAALAAQKEYDQYIKIYSIMKTERDMKYLNNKNIKGVRFDQTTEDKRCQCSQIKNYLTILTDSAKIIFEDDNDDSKLESICIISYDNKFTKSPPVNMAVNIYIQGKITWIFPGVVGDALMTQGQKIYDEYNAKRKEGKKFPELHEY